jgi:hypothetical protein
LAAKIGLIQHALQKVEEKQGAIVIQNICGTPQV